MAEESEVDRRRRFEEEALPHLDALYGTALRMTRNRGDAEDLVQETYLRALRFWDRYTPGTNCKAWLFKILTNTGINRFVKRSREPVRVPFDAVEPTLRQPDRDGFGATAAGDLPALADFLDDEVKQALESLPESFRIVLLLAVVEGFAYKEIAEMLEIPIGTVMSRLFRARRLLQEKLQTYGRSRGATREPDGSQE